MTVAIVLFTREPRVHDNPALRERSGHLSDTIGVVPRYDTDGMYVRARCTESRTAPVTGTLF